MGFEKPTPVQEACIPLIMEGRDVLASAQTGTGKTAAFAIPVLHNLLEKKKQQQEGIRALVITPTRELASQVDEAFFAIGYHTGLSTAKVYGGDDWSRQEKALSRGTNIIVATPGRLLDHIKIHDVDFSSLDFLILDEADRMLDMGFIPDITQIVSKLPKERQTLLFSATMPPKIEQLARKMMRNPERVNMAPRNMAAVGVRQGMYYVEERDKLPLVLHLFEKERWSSAIIFMSTKRAVDKLGRELRKKGADVTSIHGDRNQSEREKALESFRKGEFRIIVATDVMSRGIDVEGISHVINFSVPHDVEDYVHRIGRTARAEAKGDAITLVSGQDRRYMENIIRAMKSGITKLDVPDLYGGKKGDPAGRDGRPGSGVRSGQDTSQKEKDPKTDTRGDEGGKEEDRPDAPLSESNRNEAGERPKRRRGRKRPGGRPSGKKPQPDGNSRQPASTAVSDEAGDRPSGSKEPRKKDDPDQPSGSARRKPGRGRGRSRRKPQQGDDQAGGTADASRRGRSGQSRGQRRGGERGRGQDGPAQREGSTRKKTSRKDAKRRELFDNITSPDMAKVNKAVDKKKSLWSKVKGIFGGGET